MIKKISLSIISVFLIFAVLETGVRIYEETKLKNFPSVPDRAEAFGNFENLLKYYKDYGYVQDYYASPRGTSNDFSPYVGMLPKPNLDIKIKNIDYTTNSLGFRGSREISMPKPEGVFRIFVLGGSTVWGGWNGDWIISRYLEEELNKNPRPREGIEKFEVINAGVLGHASTNELILIETKIVDLAPDLVVVFDGFNDLQYAALPAWKPGEARDYFEEKNNLDLLVNYPSIFYLTGDIAKLLVKKSRFLTDAFRFFFRQGTPPVYPPEVKINELGISDYVGNLRLMKAVLEAERVKGLLVFQPNLSYCKNNLTPYEKSVVNYLRDREKTDWFSEAGKIWPKVASMVSAIPDSNLVKVRDASCLFEFLEETAYIDSVHYVPLTYKMIAEDIAKTIEKDLLL